MSLNPPLTHWQDRRVWVVGASTGIGHALARDLLAAGACVAVSARSAQKLDALESTAPEKILRLPLDVNDESAWRAAYARLTQDWQHLDHLIFCAADYQPLRAWELDATRARQMINTNITGAITGVATVLPAMLAEGRGAVSLIGSVAGYMGLPKSLVYGPSKSALINFAEALYLDVHERGIAVHIINPGFVDTPLTRHNDFRMPALITAAEAAREIMAGFSRGEFEIHFPKRFTRWLRLIRHLPYSLRLRLLAHVARKS